MLKYKFILKANKAIIVGDDGCTLCKSPIRGKIAWFYRDTQKNGLFILTVCDKCNSIIKTINLISGE